jgi:ferric-dicitrate binding protein FerR (iron transport regulator)
MLVMIIWMMCSVLINKSVLLIRIASLVLIFSFVVTGQSSQQAGDSVVLKDFLVEGKRPNFIEGNVEHLRGSDTAPLTLNHTFENGDVIQAGNSGRAEILLVPGYYLRLDHNTRISLLDLSPDNLKLKLWSGSAILEVALLDLLPGNEWEEQRRQLSYEPVSLLTPTAEYLVASGGSYRLNVDGKGNSQLSLLKGIAFVNGSRIDSGMTASATGERVSLTSRTKPLDDFDNWSRQRGQVLVKANHALEKSDWYKKVRSNRGYLLITDPEDPSRAKERLTVSAETGVVDIVEDALVSGAETPAWRKLQTSERLTNGDRVRTAIESRGEIHVYPTLFLFLDGDTEIVYREVEGQVAVEIIKGSAIAIVAPDAEATEAAVLTIISGKSEYRISEKGNYRINIRTSANPELMVYVGPTRVVSSELAKSKKTQPETMLKKMTGDSFDVWAHRRSKLREVRGFRRYFGPFGGMWCLVESTREYTFVPAAMEYRSPYGGAYSTAYGEPRLFFQRRRARPPEDPLPSPPRPMRP